MIGTLLSIPVKILAGTLGITVMLAMTIIGIPVALMVLFCGLGMAFASLCLVMLPICFLLIA